MPLRDNLFGVRVASTHFPVRLVAYDDRGRVVGVSTLRYGLGGPTLPPSAFHQLRTVRRVTGPNGTSATLRIGRAAHGLRCWRVDFSTGQSRRGCKGTTPTGPWVYTDLVQPAGRDVFVIGETRAPVVRVQLRFEDGGVVTTRPARGLFLLSIPRRYLSTHRQLAFAVGLADDGQVVQRQGVLFRAAP